MQLFSFGKAKQQKEEAQQLNAHSSPVSSHSQASEISQSTTKRVIQTIDFPPDRFVSIVSGDQTYMAYGKPREWLISVCDFSMRKWGYLSESTHEVVLPCVYSNVEPFVNGQAWVFQNKTWKIIDRKGKVIKEVGNIEAKRAYETTLEIAK